MIKALLGLSFILNLILGYILLKDKPGKEFIERERLIIETHPRETKQDKRPINVMPVNPDYSNPPKEEKKKTATPEFVGLDQYEFQDAGEKMENERQEFFAESLGMSEDKIAEHNRLRDEFFKASTHFWQKNPMKELSFKERRQLLEMEENFHKKLEKLHGKKNWEKYQKFREDYNAKGYKKQMDEGQPFLFMGL